MAGGCAAAGGIPGMMAAGGVAAVGGMMAAGGVTAVGEMMAAGGVTVDLEGCLAVWLGYCRFLAQTEKNVFP